MVILRFTNLEALLPLDDFLQLKAQCSPFMLVSYPCFDTLLTSIVRFLTRLLQDIMARCWGSDFVNEVDHLSVHYICLFNETFKSIDLIPHSLSIESLVPKFLVQILGQVSGSNAFNFQTKHCFRTLVRPPDKHGR
jgi:hypothetical protein